MLENRTWLLIGRKMANEASPEELAELEGILKSNPELHFTIQALSDLWQQSPAGDRPDLDTAYQKHLERMNKKGSDMPGTIIDDFTGNPALNPYPQKKRFQMHRALMAATFLGIIAITAWFLFPFRTTTTATVNPRNEASEISTHNGSKSNIVLPDGSKVWLNAGSKIIYDKDFDETIREVKLTGEAYFDVVHNPQKPFIIHTRAMDIKVLGTEFNVKSYPDEQTTETSLIRGSIEVTLNDKRAGKIILKPNEKLVVNNQPSVDTQSVQKEKKTVKSVPIISLGTLNYFSLDSTILETSWVNNRLVFEDESFEEIARKMSRWYGVMFYFKDEDIKNMRFTGNFSDETIEEALNAMQITADFRYTIEDKNVTITKTKH